MPTASNNDNFTAYHFYVDKDFKTIMRAFDLLIKHDLRLEDFKVNNLQKENGLRSFFIRKFIERYVLNNKDIEDADRVLTPQLKKLVDEYFEKKKP